MQVKIKDSELKIFSKDAKNTLTEHLQNYAEHMKTEAERIAVAQYGATDAKVTMDIIDGVIKTQGHHVKKKPSIFYSYILPLLGTIFGGLLCNALFKEDKTVWTGIIIAACIFCIIGVVFLSSNHEKGK